jgi:predicted metal-binding protein
VEEHQIKPQIQIWVCKNERPCSHALPSCTHSRGTQVYQALQKALLVQPIENNPQIWINFTYCQGSCTKDGVSVTIEPSQKRFRGVLPEDAPLIASNLKETKT